MCHNEEHLFPPDLLLGKPGVLAVADLRCQAVYGGLADQGAIHDRTAGLDQGSYLVRQRDLRTVDNGKKVPKRPAAPP